MKITWNASEELKSLVASGGVVEQEELLYHPPAEWFELNPEKDKSYSVQFEADGRIHGYVSDWGLSHIGFLNRSVPTPRSFTNYSKYRTGTVLCDNGAKVRTGRMTINTVHPKMKNAAFNEVAAFYDHTGSAVGDVVPFEDKNGIFVAGAVRPGVTREQLRVARASDWSPDWRGFNGNLEMVACLGVNLSGFVVDGLVASGGFAEYANVEFTLPGESYIEFDVESGEVQTLIKTNSLKNVEHNDFTARLERVEAFMRRQEIKERLQSLSEFM